MRRAFAFVHARQRKNKIVSQCRRTSLSSSLSLSLPPSLAFAGGRERSKRTNERAVVKLYRGEIDSSICHGRDLCTRCRRYARYLRAFRISRSPATLGPLELPPVCHLREASAASGGRDAIRDALETNVQKRIPNRTRALVLRSRVYELLINNVRTLSPQPLCDVSLSLSLALTFALCPTPTLEFFSR